MCRHLSESETIGLACFVRLAEVLADLIMYSEVCFIGNLMPYCTVCTNEKMPDLPQFYLVLSIGPALNDNTMPVTNNHTKYSNI